MTIFNFVFKRTLKGKFDIFMLLLPPIITAFISVETWLPIPLGFQMYGVILMFLSSKLCKTMMEDREKKVILRISAAPITHLRYLMENLLAYTLILSSINIIVVGIGVLRYGSVTIPPLNMFLLFSVFSATSIGLSIAWYALFKHTETAYSILGGLYISMAMLGGMFWPIEIMPQIIRRIVQILPTYWFALGMRQVVYTGYDGNLFMTIGILLLFSVAFIMVGSRKRLG
ncbi:ABC transporter permease [Alkalibaculum sp. M08DMB]|uniref:ABC transporter permease n=1 Tax=Alkalibaculum sporogenes TaxID=2655001 RepID=A0A6A7K7R0_9FIRM|nr:ABC transporter permease [Alkalibaculum sporogenes]MPW25454.1 ABC transporter permease [Alkalibaculum sporogenes]